MDSVAHDMKSAAHYMPSVVVVACLSFSPRLATHKMTKILELFKEKT